MTNVPEIWVCLHQNTRRIDSISVHFSLQSVSPFRLSSARLENKSKSCYNAFHILCTVLPTIKSMHMYGKTEKRFYPVDAVNWNSVALVKEKRTSHGRDRGSSALIQWGIPSAYTAQLENTGRGITMTTLEKSRQLQITSSCAVQNTVTNLPGVTVTQELVHFKQSLIQWFPPKASVVNKSCAHQ